MENLIYCCPICHGKVLVEETINPRPERVGESVKPAKVYCPHCEMLVVPVATSSAAAEAAGNIRGSIWTSSDTMIHLRCDLRRRYTIFQSLLRVLPDRPGR